MPSIRAPLIDAQAPAPVADIEDDATAGRQPARRILAHYSMTLLGVGIVTLAAVLRSYDVAANGFSLDEVWSIWMAGHPAFEIVRSVLLEGADSSPPTYVVLLHFILRLGDQPLLVRAPSILAGTLMVWVTFRLAADLFDQRVAALASFLLAIAPLHLAFSRVARAYVPAALLALLSLYFLSRLLFLDGRARNWIGFLIATIAALYVHYLVFVLVLFENAWVGLFWLRGRLSSVWLRRWAISQAMLGVALLPTLLQIKSVQEGTGQDWLGRPGPLAVVRGAILYSTGNPSYGPTGVTPLRALVIVTLVCIGILGLRMIVARASKTDNDELWRVAFLAGAFFVPWLTALLAGRFRPIFTEKYYLFVVPPLLVVFAWIFMRSRSRIPALVVLVALMGLTGKALVVYYTQPFSDQYREAIASMRPAYQPNDLVIVSPGFFFRPFGYYFYRAFPPVTLALRRAPVILVDHGDFRVLTFVAQGDDVHPSDPALAGAERVWLLSGGPDAPPQPAVVGWLDHNLGLADAQEFAGARVQLWQRP